LPKGRQLVTLKDASRYIQKLPKAEQQIEEWQTAVEVLILVAESNGGPTMLARIGVMRALNRHVERVFEPSRKDGIGDAASWRGTDDRRFRVAAKNRERLIFLSRPAQKYCPLKNYGPRMIAGGAGFWRDATVNARGAVFEP
jgi:hypothetical protein